MWKTRKMVRRWKYYYGAGTRWNDILFWVPEKNKKFPGPDFLHYLSHFVYNIVCIHAWSESKRAGMYGRGMHAKWDCHLAMYRRVTIPIVRRNQSKKRVAAPSELGDFSRRAGRWIARHNLQSSSQYPEIRTNTTMLERLVWASSKHIHLCDDHLIKRPLKIQFEIPTSCCCIWWGGGECRRCTEMHLTVQHKKGYRRLDVNLSFYTKRYILWPKQIDE